MASVVVTGATGFIGSHLVEALVRRGDRVKCLVRASSKTQPLSELGAALCTLDFAHAEALSAAVAGADVVYHLAGVTRTSNRRRLFAVNEAYARAMATACAGQARPPHLVVVSSVAGAGPGRRGQLRVETDVENPVSNYGQSKLAGERAAERAAGKAPLTIIRPGIVFGPRDTDCLKIFQSIRWLNAHFSPGLFSSPALSYIHVEDLVELLLRAGDAYSAAGNNNGEPAARRLYFAAAPEHPSYAEFGRIVGPMLGRRWAIVIPMATPVAWCLGAAGEAFSLVTRRDDALNFDKMREALVESWACSGEAAERAFDFRPAKPLVERLQETIDWHSAAGQL